MRIKKFLPNPFILVNGTPVTSHAQWDQWRRETKELILELEYGAMPPAPEETQVQIIKTEKEAGTGAMVFQKLRFRFLPKITHADVFFNLDISMRFPTPAILDRVKKQIPRFGQAGLPCVIYVGDNPCTELYEAGYIIINYAANQLEPMEMGNPIVGTARTAYNIIFPNLYTWGSISVWAWGALRILDYAVTRPEINRDQIIITGHSRNGKTSLLAGALDERIAIVNPAGSGCAGAGSYLALDEGCEDIASLTDKRRWWAWMTPDFATYGYNENKMLFDQHFVMGLVTPRPLLRTEGILDEWANPKGTEIAFLATEEIYEFLNELEHNQLAYRAGGHNHTHEDLLALLSVANAHFFGIPQERLFKDLVVEPKDLPPFMDWKCPKIDQKK